MERIAIVRIKEELDVLYSRVNPPYGVIPKWHAPAATDEEIAAVEKRLGIALPAEVKEVCKEFSGITDSAPYFMGEQFRFFQEKAAGVIGHESASFLEDNFRVNGIFPLNQWGVPDEIWNPRIEYCEVIEEYEESKADGDAIESVVAYIGCVEGILSDELFVHIGNSESESVFIYLNASSENFGAIYNVDASRSEAFLLVYKIADNYLDFIECIKKSLEIQLQSEGA